MSNIKLLLADESPPSSDTSRLNGHSDYSNSGITSNHLASTSASTTGTRVNLLVSSSSSNASSIPASPKHPNTVGSQHSGIVFIVYFVLAGVHYFLIP